LLLSSGRLPELPNGRQGLALTFSLPARPPARKNFILAGSGGDEKVSNPESFRGKPELSYTAFQTCAGAFYNARDSYRDWHVLKKTGAVFYP
jgi:hypothetical protein